MAVSQVELNVNEVQNSLFYHERIFQDFYAFKVDHI